jgi:hypothetical protein
LKRTDKRAAAVGDTIGALGGAGKTLEFIMLSSLGTNAAQRIAVQEDDLDPGGGRGGLFLTPRATTTAYHCSETHHF